MNLLLLWFLVIVLLSIDAIKSNQPSSVVIPLSGNVFPLGYYSASLRIGNPPKDFTFDIDTGSDLTWVQCDAPCSRCTMRPPLLYKPKANTVPCSDPLCSALNWPKKPQCPNPKEQCDYEVTYADQGSSMGALVIDQFPLPLLNGSSLQSRLAFGLATEIVFSLKTKILKCSFLEARFLENLVRCGYDQSFPSAHLPPATAGVLGLGRGRISVLKQLVLAGLTKNVIGHCLSFKSGGFLFFGDNLIPSLGMAWTPLVSPDNHYTTGPAELLFNGKPTGLKGLKLIFDTGSSYTYFNSQAYQTIINQSAGKEQSL